MTTALKIAAAAAALSALAPAAFAQATDSATANASATIIAPLAITKNTDLTFGSVVRSAAGGTVVITNTSSATRTPSGVAVIAGSTFSPAKFTVTGQQNQAYNVTYSTLQELSGPGGNTIGITLTPSASSGTLSTGTDTIYVGGAITLSANQATGTYSGSFTATVNYQ